MKNELENFIDQYLEMSNRELFDFIQDYGETQFFVDLWLSITVELEGGKNWYANITHAYFVTKSYFETHQ